MPETIEEKLENMLADWCTSRKLSPPEALEVLEQSKKWLEAQIAEYHQETCMSCRQKPATPDGYCDTCFPSDGSANMGSTNS